MRKNIAPETFVLGLFTYFDTDAIALDKLMTLILGMYHVPEIAESLIARMLFKGKLVQELTGDAVIISLPYEGKADKPTIH